MSIELGSKVKDTVSGLVGIAASSCHYLHGCTHIGIQAPAQDGKIPPVQWVDEPQVEVVKKRAGKPSTAPRASRGGPAPHPHGRGHPPSDHGE